MDRFIFDAQESKHIIKVLRKTEGDTIHITNGLGNLFICHIISANEKKCTVKIDETATFSPSTYHIHIAVAPTKMNERLEWFLEKATEIGVHEITPIICEHSERKIIKTERFEKIIQSAMKQSQQFFLPVLNAPRTFKQFINEERPGDLFIAHCEEDQKTELQQLAQPQRSYTLLIGPEGDFSTSEIELAKKRNYLAVALGKTRLRTETAALVACHTLVLINHE